MKTIMAKPKQEDLVTKAVKEKDVVVISDALFNVKLKPTQAEIVRIIAFSEHKRLVISCMTRYGKTFSVAIGVLLYVLFNKNKRILLISPLIAQTKIMRDYIAEFLMTSPLIEKLDIGVTGPERLKSEVSKQRLTFKNQCSLTILSAEGDATRLMGWGGDLIIIDETGLISDEVWRFRISRMLGDSPDSILVEIGNPFKRDNHMYEHWIDPAFKKIHIGAELALKEGRVTQQFLDEQKERLTPFEYGILYDAKFPVTSKDALFSYDDIKACTEEKFDYEDVDYTAIISCDPADKGDDLTVIMEGKEHEGLYQIEDIYSEAKSENTVVSGKIIDAIVRAGDKHRVRVNIDTIGIGVGVVSQVREYINTHELYYVSINPCHFGEGVGSSGKEESYASDRLDDRQSDSARKRFANRKAEQYFRLSDIFKAKEVSIPTHKTLMSQLMSIGWEYTSTYRNKIVDPEKSPDFADAMVYFTWKTDDEFFMEWARPI